MKPDGQTILGDFLAVDYALLSTTSLGRVRGFSIQLLFMLHDGGGRCCDLAERSGKSQKYVYQYLKNLRKYGLVIKNEAFWFLNDSGAEFVKYLDIVYNNIIYYQKKEERKKKESQKKEKSSAPKVPKQISLGVWSRNNSLGDCEKAVVEVLVDHYNKTSSKYILFPDHYTLSDRLGFDLNTTATALTRLRMDNIIYLIKDQTQGCWKLGLKKAFVDALEREGSE